MIIKSVKFSANSCQKINTSLSFLMSENDHFDTKPLSP